MCSYGIVMKVLLEGLETVDQLNELAHFDISKDRAVMLKSTKKMK